MSFENIMGIAGQAMDAQTVRINAAVSNIANADTQARSAEEAFKAKRVIFQTILASEVNQNRGDTVGGVRVAEIAEDLAPAPAVYSGTGCLCCPGRRPGVAIANRVTGKNSFRPDRQNDP